MALPLCYHWRNLFARKTTTILTVLVVAAVVATFAWMFGFALALDRTLSVAGDERKLIVLRRGATSETNSAVPVEEFNKLTQLADLARDAGGDALLSPEMLVQVQLPRLSDGGKTLANIAVRGVLDVAFQVHSHVRVEGRKFDPGGREVIVGRAAARQFAGLEVGKTIRLGYGNDRDYIIAGFFSADGGPLESEVWGYLPSLMNAYNRTMYSAATLRLREGADAAQSIEQIEGPAIQLAARTEENYWVEQTGRVSLYLNIVLGLVGVMSVAAVISIAITMFSSVAGRTREFAMLRTIGFTPAQIISSVVVESVFLALIAGVLGCLACAAWLRIAGATKDMFGATTFTSLAFEIALSPWIVIAALVMVSVVAVMGALWPAWRASRLEVVAALREE